MVIEKNVVQVLYISAHEQIQTWQLYAHSFFHSIANLYLHHILSIVQQIMKF